MWGLLWMTDETYTFFIFTSLIHLHFVVNENRRGVRTAEEWCNFKMAFWASYTLLCKIWGSHSGGYEEYYLLGYNAMLCLPPAFALVSCSAYFSTLKMEAICSSETPVDFQRTTRHYIPEDSILIDCCLLFNDVVLNAAWNGGKRNIFTLLSIEIIARNYKGNPKGDK
jgi:hypothetical protein